MSSTTPTLFNLEINKSNSLSGHTIINDQLLSALRLKFEIVTLGNSLIFLIAKINLSLVSSFMIKYFSMIPILNLDKHTKSLSEIKCESGGKRGFVRIFNIMINYNDSER